MYLPPAFAQHDPLALAALMAAHPLATLVTHTAAGLGADALPLLHDPAATPAAPLGVLRGHVARANPLWRGADGRDVLAVFHGPQGYVSPSWYPGKAVHHKVVPTWNYVVLHAHGTLRAVDDAGWMHTLVRRLTATHESTRAAPWAVDDAPPDYVAQMLRAVVGIEITLTRLEGKWKLSQNRDAADRAGVVRGLDGEPAGAALASMMRA
jgi:transcriptional regulator